MKKTLVQVFSTLLILWIIFTANNMSSAFQTTSVFSQPDRSAIPVPIIMYHSLLKDGSRAGKYVISPNTLHNDLKYLAEKGYTTITVSDLIAYSNDGTPLPPKPIMLTFDDGYYNNYVYAMPILKELHMKAVVSIIGSQTALFTETEEENAYWSYVSIEHLQQMISSDIFEVQNHSWKLHTYKQRHGCLRIHGEDSQIYERMLRSDTEQVQTLLKEAGLPTPTCYTYPFGSYSDESETILRNMGFSCTLGCEEGMNYVTRDPHCLFVMKRWNRPSGISTETFMKKMGVT